MTNREVIALAREDAVVEEFWRVVAGHRNDFDSTDILFAAQAAKQLRLAVRAGRSNINPRGISEEMISCAGQAWSNAGLDRVAA